MRYSKSMIEAVQQVGLYEMMDYAIIDGDNKIIGLYKGNMAKKQAQLNMKGAERQVGVKKPLKIMPVSKKKVGDTVIGIGELTDKERGEIEEDRKNALAGFDNRIKDGGMDRKDFIKAKELYKRKDIKGLRKHIYSLDTSPLEVVMNLISIQDRPFFDKMYPNTRGGEFLARIAYQHRNLDEKLDENKDDEKKRMKGAKLRLKMGDALDEKKQAGYIAMYGDKKVEIPLSKAKDLYQAKQIAIKMMNVPKSKQGLLAIQPAYEETIKEDGHTDVSSAVRQCKTITEDAMQIMGKLQSMSGEDSLPTWWTNKLAVASNSMNKIRDYLLVPSMQEALDKEDEPKVKEIIKKLKGTSKAHAGQAKDLEKAVKEGKMKQMKMYIDDIASAMKKDRNMKPFVQRFVKDAEKTLNPKKSLEKVLPDYIPGKDIAKLLNMGEGFASDAQRRAAFAQGYKAKGKKGKKEEMKERELTPRELKRREEIAKKLDLKDFEKRYGKDKGMSVKMAVATKMAKKETEEGVKFYRDVTSKDLLENKYKDEKDGAQHFSKVDETEYVWNFVYDDFGRTKLTTEPDKATHLVYTMEGLDNPQLLKISEREILDYKKGENNELSKK